MTLRELRDGLVFAALVVIGAVCIDPDCGRVYYGIVIIANAASWLVWNAVNALRSALGEKPALNPEGRSS